tara:strand:- start:2859 stop:3431 length:573 start_codon:yes stop_codon:yes gene_type:complete
MSNPYLEQCVQLGRELAVKEASATRNAIWTLLGDQPRSLFGGSALMDTLGLLGGSAALAAGVKAMSRNKALRNINRNVGAAGGALGGAGLGLGTIYHDTHTLLDSPLGMLRNHKTLAPALSRGGEALGVGDSTVLGRVAAETAEAVNHPEFLNTVMPYIYAPALLGAYAGNKLVKGSEKLQPILAKKLSP